MHLRSKYSLFVFLLALPFVVSCNRKLPTWDYAGCHYARRTSTERGDLRKVKWMSEQYNKRQRKQIKCYHFLP